MASSWRVVLLVSAIALGGASYAAAQAVDGVAFTDPMAALAGESDPSVSLTAREDARRSPAPAVSGEADDARALELEFAAAGDAAGVPLDVAVARRASIGADADGDIGRRGEGAELRVGRGLVQRDDDGPSAQPSVYMFVASDDEALTWRPGQRDGAAVALQDRVEVGDISAGVTYERNGVQASLAVVEREVSAQVGQQSYSTDERFAGVTVTVRR